MGKWIDRAAMAALTALGLYILFLQAFGSVPAAAVLSFACTLMLVRRRSLRGAKYRLTRMQAEAILQKLAYGDDAEARCRIALLTNCPEAELVYLGKHPTASVGTGDVFGAWKSHRGEQRLVLAAPCYADSRARAFAKTLREPSVEIADAAKLIPLLRKSGWDGQETGSFSARFSRLKAFCSDLPCRRPWPKNLLTGLFLLIFYLFTGNILYLIVSMGMLLRAGAGIRARA
ncbi:MAG: hypothetical protein IJO98_02720 [Clostridia bacterium]|nr:hypothetical protein [Clostridia bacterium]